MLPKIPVIWNPNWDALGCTCLLGGGGADYTFLEPPHWCPRAALMGHLWHICSRGPMTPHGQEKTVPTA